MGFGLATDYRIIQDHDGEIHIDSEIGAGTQVVITLPLRNERDYAGLRPGRGQVDLM